MIFEPRTISPPVMLLYTETEPVFAFKSLTVIVPSAKELAALFVIVMSPVEEFASATVIFPPLLFAIVMFLPA